MNRFVILILAIGSLWAQWEVKDSVSFTIRIPADDNCYIYCDYAAETLCVVKPLSGVIQVAQDAVAYAPDWLKVELEDNFSRLDSSYQDLYATMILNSQDPYVDEIAFCIAHLSPQVLTYYYFDPNIISFNAELIYAFDDSLDYVSIIDYPGPSFYSTTKYFVAESIGGGVDTFEVELPKEIYYWFIVNPKLHKEFPAYIDPNTGNPSPTGYFWRDYLFNHADAGYPLLSDSLIGINTLWNNLSNSLDNGALGRVTDWIQDVMVFQSASHHDQPVRIYHLHLGTCSVHSYLTAGAARTCLIPATVSVAYRYNHKWNEFYDRRWIQWEPVNTWIDYYSYDHWGSGDNIPGCFNWRGDGYIWTITERYTPVCTLNVHINDAQGNSVDGARITIDCSGYPGPWVTLGWTTSSGDCQFLLGDTVSYFTGAVQSAIGNISTTTIIPDTTVTNVTYYWNPTLTGTIAQLKAMPDTLPSSPLDDYKFEYTIEVPNEILYGTNSIDYNEFSDFSHTGNIDFFICDSTNFAAYASNDSFYAFQIIEDASSLDGSFTLPSDENWYLVFSNEDQVVNKAVANVTVKLLENPEGIAEGFVTNQFNGLHITPNPFKSKTDISFGIGHRAKCGEYSAEGIELKIYDVSGRMVKSFNLASGILSLASAVSWFGTDQFDHPVPAGVYFVRLETKDFKAVEKIILLR